MNVTFYNILEQFAQYSMNDKELFLEIIKNRLIDEKREMISRKYKKAQKDYKQGKVKKGNTEDLFKLLND